MTTEVTALTALARAELTALAQVTDLPAESITVTSTGNAAYVNVWVASMTDLSKWADRLGETIGKYPEVKAGRWQVLLTADARSEFTASALADWLTS